MGSVCIFFGENILLLQFTRTVWGQISCSHENLLTKGTNGACELQHFEKVVDKRYSGAIQYDQVEKLSTHKIRQDVFRKEDVLPSPHKDSIPADFVSAGFLFVHDNRMLAERAFYCCIRKFVSIQCYTIKNAPRGCTLDARVDGCRSNRASAQKYTKAHSFYILYGEYE